MLGSRGQGWSHTRQARSWSPTTPAALSMHAQRVFGRWACPRSVLSRPSATAPWARPRTGGRLLSSRGQGWSRAKLVTHDARGAGTARAKGFLGSGWCLFAILKVTLALAVMIHFFKNEPGAQNTHIFEMCTELDLDSEMLCGVAIILTFAPRTPAGWSLTTSLPFALQAQLQRVPWRQIALAHRIW